MGREAQTHPRLGPSGGKAQTKEPPPASGRGGRWLPACRHRSPRAPAPAPSRRPVQGAARQGAQAPRRAPRHRRVRRFSRPLRLSKGARAHLVARRRECPRARDREPKAPAHRALRTQALRDLRERKEWAAESPCAPARPQAIARQTRAWPACRHSFPVSAHKAPAHRARHQGTAATILRAGQHLAPALYLYLQWKRPPAGKKSLRAREKAKAKEGGR